MKKSLLALSLLAMGGWANATVGPVQISSGSGFYTVDTSTITGGYVRQRVVVGDDSLPSGFAPVSSITGLTVNLATSTAIIGKVQTGTYNLGVDLSTGVQVNGTVTVNQGTPSTQDWRVTMGTNAVTGTVTSNQGTAGTADWPVRVSTVVVNQGTAGTVDWPVRITSTTIISSTITIMSPNGNTTAIPVTGSFSASSVNITTASPNGALPTAGVLIGGTNPSNTFQSFRVSADSAIFVNISSAVTIPISGSISAQSANVTTATYNASLPTIGSALGFINDSGLTQSPKVDISSRTMVNISTGVNLTVNQGVAGTTAWRIDLSTGVSVNQGTPSSNAWAVSLTTTSANQGTAGTADWSVKMTSTVVKTGTAFLQVDFSTGISVNQGTPSSNAWSVSLTTTSAKNTLLVSSNTSLPSASADATQIQTMGDPYGRIVTQSGVPTGIVLSTQPAAITGTTSIVLVSSPSSTLFTHMCGCSVFNTSATDTYVTIYPSGNTTTSNFFRIGAPKANFTNGIWPGCDKPFLNTTSGGVQVTVNAAASVSSLYVQCQFYQSTTP